MIDARVCGDRSGSILGSGFCPRHDVIRLRRRRRGERSGVASRDSFAVGRGDPPRSPKRDCRGGVSVANEVSADRRRPSRRPSATSRAPVTTFRQRLGGGRYGQTRRGFAEPRRGVGVLPGQSCREGLRGCRGGIPAGLRRGSNFAPTGRPRQVEPGCDRRPRDRLRCVHPVPDRAISVSSGGSYFGGRRAPRFRVFEKPSEASRETLARGCPGGSETRSRGGRSRGSREGSTEGRRGVPETLVERSRWRAERVTKWSSERARRSPPGPPWDVLPKPSWRVASEGREAHSQGVPGVRPEGPCARSR